MSFTTRDAEARIESLERQVGEIYQNQAILSMALTRLTQIVDDAAAPTSPEGSA